MDTTTLLQEHRATVFDLANQHGARNIRIFGSAARGDDQPDSDIDLLIDLDPDRSLLDLAELVADLRDLLGRRVDIVIEQDLHTHLRDSILREARSL